MEIVFFFGSGYTFCKSQVVSPPNDIVNLLIACKEALKQIKEKRYAEALNGFRTVICYGIAFEGKDCLIEQLTEENGETRTFRL